jgi:hypothetical protein
MLMIVHLLKFSVEIINNSIGGDMKKKTLIPTAFFCLFLSATTVFSQVGKPGEIDAEHQIVFKNPLKGLCCGNEDTRLDCAFVLGELRYKKATIPLMKLLREDPSEAVRIVAAQSLIKIGDPQGVYLVSRTIEFNNSDKVKKYAEKFYNSYLYQQYVNKNNKEFSEEILAAMESAN